MLVVRDISDRKEFEERVANIAYRDSLTGLPNRMLFTDRLQQAMSLARRNRHMVAVMFLDLDRFKHINDTLGHTYGDQLLVTITERLVECLRETDTVAQYKDHAPVSTLARLGGDEFTIILSQIKGVQDVTRVASRILRTVAQPIWLKGEQIRVTLSIGIALYPIDGQDVDGLLRNADAALYHAKERGKNNYQLYTESINSVSHQRLKLEAQLRKAIQEDQLDLYYQPQFNLKTGRLEGMEALVRWIHPERGFISPSLFIPIAEESDLIGDVGRWVLRRACEQALAWIEMGYDWLCVSVNVSGQQFKEGQLIHSLERVLKEVPVPYHNLGIEITETAIMANPELSADMLKIIRSMDVKISLDDFGTGYSSLNYLKQFPIDVLKIDQSFVREMTVNSEDAALTDAIISMSHALGKTVVAEGVETEDHLAFLTAKGCDIIQGYHYCRPLPVDKVTAFMETQVQP
jgi:diguanylate cyclase (GGDEF)-like protein